jgi:hypothetical protein
MIRILEHFRNGGSSGIIVWRLLLLRLLKRGDLVGIGVAVGVDQEL